MKIAILGTRGIPNNYGGFEQFAEYLSVGLVERGHSVTVYNTSFHHYKESSYKGVSICSKYSPEDKIGASANFIYDFLCLRDALKKDFDIIYELGYHSNAPSYYLLRRRSPIVVTNMDGIEWQRSKWNAFTRKLIKYLEKIAVKKSDYLISDNPAIGEYYQKEFNQQSFYIPYGAEICETFDSKAINLYNIDPQKYFLIIARLEPENNIEIVLDGYILSRSHYPFLVIGNKDTPYGEMLQQKYRASNILFLGAIYDKRALDNLRHFSLLYFHGHSVGGTNPSLLEAMASRSVISAHDNPFNRAVLADASYYFKDKDDVGYIINTIEKIDFSEIESLLQKNSENIRQNYSWEKIISDYETLFERLIKSEKRTL